MVLTYDLLEDRHINTTNILPLFFKMAEIFMNLDKILRDWGKKNVEKCLVEVVEKYERRRKKEKDNLSKNDTQKYLSSLSCVRLN